VTTSSPQAPAAAVHGLPAGVLRRNLSSVAASYGVGAVVGFATQSVLGHRLGSTTYGVYATALALATTLSVVQEVAGPAWLVRMAAQDPARYRDLAGAVLAFRLVAGVAVVAAATAVAVALGGGAEPVAVAALVAVVTGVNAVLRALRTGFQVAERMPVAAALTTANAVVTAAVMIGLVLAGAGLVVAVVGSAVVSLALVPVSWRLLPAQMRPRLALVGAPRALSTAALTSMPFTVVATLETVLSYADTIVIRAFLGPTQTGLYGAAFRLVTVLQWVPSIVLDSVMRAMSSLAVNDRERFRVLVDRSAAGLLLVGLPIAAAGSLLARPVMLLVFGSDFGDGADAFRVLLWSLPLSYPAWIASEAALVGARPAAVGRLLAGVVAANIAVNIAVVPHFGIVGSAWITLGSELAMLVAASAVLHRHGITPRWVVAIVPAAVLAAVTTAAVAPLASAPLGVPIAVGVATYAAAVLVMWAALRTTAAGRALLVRTTGWQPR